MRLCIRRCAFVLTERRRVLKSAVYPQGVEAALETDGRFHANIALKDLTVVADRLDDVVRPVRAEAQLFTLAALHAQEAQNLGILGFFHRVDVGTCDALFLGRDRRVENPGYDVGPLVVTVTGGRTEGLLRDDLGQDDVILRIRERRPGRGQARGVGGVDVAPPSSVVLPALVVGLEGHGLVLHAIGVEVIGQVELGRRAGLDADRGAVEFLGAAHAEFLAHHEALAVIVVDAVEPKLHADIAREGDGGVPPQHVALTRVKQGEPGLAGRGDRLDLARIPQDRRGSRTAEIDVEAFPDTVCVRVGEAGDAGADDAAQHAAGLDVFKRSRRRRRRDGKRSDHKGRS